LTPAQSSFQFCPATFVQCGETPLFAAQSSFAQIQQVNSLVFL